MKYLGWHRDWANERRKENALKVVGGECELELVAACWGLCFPASRFSFALS